MAMTRTKRIANSSGAGKSRAALTIISIRLDEPLPEGSASLMISTERFDSEYRMLDERTATGCDSRAQRSEKQEMLGASVQPDPEQEHSWCNWQSELSPF